MPGASTAPGRFSVLGTDGFRLTESREDLRDHFEVSTAHIVQAALVDLYRSGRMTEQVLREQTSTLGIDAQKVDPAAR